MRIAEPVTMVLTRRVRPGHEQAYEAVLRRLTAAAERRPGFEAVTVLRPEPGGRSAYAIVVQFRSEPELAAWLDAPERAVLLAEADQHCRSDLQVQQSHGVEGWFTVPGDAVAGPPPRVKMAVTTWFGLLPLLLPVNLYLAPRLSAIPPVPRIAVGALVITGVMTYVMMPALTRLLRPWLWPRPGT